MAASGLAVAFQDAVELIVQVSCHEARELSTLLGPASKIEAVIIDVELFDGDASRAVDTVRVVDPGVAVLLLTTHVDESLLEALARDGVACVSAYSEGQSILSALRALLVGQPLLPSEVQRALMARFSRPWGTQSVSGCGERRRPRDAQRERARGMTAPHDAACSVQPVQLDRGLPQHRTTLLLG
jgi:DNA-binding NarL/FixJ family response regulator